MSTVWRMVVGKSFDFVASVAPSWNEILFGSPLSLVWAYASLYLAGYLRTRRLWPMGYTRKVFHFLIFTGAALTHRLWGLPSVCVFGSMTTMVVFYAVLKGAGHPLYEAMARQKDAPRRTHYIIVPYLATLIGGLASNIIAGEAAVAGYLVAGLGDAVGEPVGTRFGRHTYRVPSLGCVESVRSCEGSAAVLVVSLAAVAAGVFLCGHQVFSPRLMFSIAAIGTTCALLEAVSPHGWDNAVMQVVPSVLVKMLVGGS